MRTILLAALVLAGMPAAAAVTAAVDPNPVAFGQPLTLTITLTGDDSGEPDWAPLENDFVIVNRRSTSNLQTANGASVSSRTWTLVLSARRPGAVTIPAFRIGRESSRPISLVVSPARQPAEPQTAIVEFEIDRPRAYVQQQVLLTTRLFVMPEVMATSFSDPTADGAVIEPLGDAETSQARRGNVRYQVYERRYALFPMRAGELRLSPPLFKGAISLHPGPSLPFGGHLPAGGIREFFVTAAEKTIAVLAPPADSASHWLPASKLNLRETLLPQTGPYAAGDAWTRTVELQVEGQLPARIPALETTFPEGLKIYPDVPVARTDRNARGLSVTRTQQWAIVPVRAGEFVLPEVRVHWWDVAANRPRVAVLAARTIAAAAPQAGAAAATPGTQTGSAPVTPAGLRIWQWLAAIALSGWLITGAAWIALHRRRRAHTHARAATAAENLRHARAQLDRALRDPDPAAVRASLIVWARLRFADARIAGLHAIAAAARSERLSWQLEQLDRAIYSQTAGWDGRPLAAAIAALPTTTLAPPRQKDAFPPLYPQSPGLNR